MSEKEHSDPFEDHIESELFDVSKLDLSAYPTEPDPRVRNLLDGLPEPLDYRVWDHYLNHRQQQLCANLSYEMVQRVFRAQYTEEFCNLSDEELIVLLTPIIAATIYAEERLRPDAAFPAFTAARLRARLNEESALQMPPPPPPVPQRGLRDVLCQWRASLIRGFRGLFSVF